MRFHAICLALVFAGFLSGCPDGTHGIPVMVSSIPASRDQAVPINRKITVTFDQPMDANTINSASFKVECPDGNVILGATGYSVSNTVGLYFPPEVGLPTQSGCTATLSTAVAGVNGKALTAPIAWGFGTGIVPDTTRPILSSTRPVDTEKNILINRKIIVTFSEAMDPATISTTTFTLASEAGPVSGTVSWAGLVATFTPSSNLEAGISYTATITSGAADLAGNSLTDNYSWQFQTQSNQQLASGGGGGSGLLDALAPTVSSAAPVPHAVGVPIDRKVSVLFSEAMDPITIAPATFQLACPIGTPIVGTVDTAGDGRDAAFTPINDLPPNTECTAAIATGAKDLAGNSIETPFVWTFTTGDAPDTISPFQSSTAPIGDATLVLLDSLVTIAFNEPMNPLTITNANCGLECPAGTPIVGTVGYVVGGNVAIFIPAAKLPATTICHATVTNGATDAAGNALATPYSWSFTTGLVPDLIPPTVSTIFPLSGANDVAFNTQLTAAFSESMDPLTINTSSFSLECPLGTDVPVTVGYAVTGNVATFTPLNDLPPNTSCMATITMDVTDSAGNALPTPYNWTFTTSAIPDLTPPAESSTAPISGATSVPLETLVTVAFNEPMDPLSITTANYGLECPAGTPILGTVGYVVGGNVAIFIPDAKLPATTICLATVTTGATDAAGNALTAPFSWTFTTGVVPDTTFPTLHTTLPPNGATNVPFNILLNAAFSEAMDPLTINTSSFSLDCPVGTAVPVTVAYAVTGNVATFTPTSDLPPGTHCAATVTTNITDLASNTLAAPYTWFFTTGVAPDITPPTVAITVPSNGATNVSLDTLVTAVFNEPIDPLTVNTSTFSLECPAGTAVSGAVQYTVSGNIATFTPTLSLSPTIVCTATATTGIKDLAGNALASNQSWSFTTSVAPPLGPAAVNLGTAQSFALLSEAGISNSPTSTIIGNIGTGITGAAITGLGCTEVTGTIYTIDAAGPICRIMDLSVVSTAISDMGAAYTDAAGRLSPDQTGLGGGEIGGLIIPPGLYKWHSNVSVSANVTLSGAPNDVWIFQIDQDLTLANGKKVLLVGGALAKNIFWQVAGQAVLESSSVFNGTILSQHLIAMNPNAVVIGRALAKTQITLNRNQVTKP